jgi:hypothetical protein
MMRQITLYDLNPLKPDDKSDAEFRAAIIRILREVAPCASLSFADLTPKELTLIKAKLESLGIQSTVQEQHYNVIFPLEHVDCPFYAHDLLLDKLGEGELSDWMQYEAVDEAYRFVTGDAEVIRISPKHIVRTSLKMAQKLADPDHRDLDRQTWVDFCNLIEETGFWSDNKSAWEGSQLMEFEGGELIFEGWKSTEYQLRRDATGSCRRKYAPISTFLSNILQEN